MYINGNLGQSIDLVGAGLVDPADQFLPNIPGTSIPVDIKPAQNAMLSTLYGLGVVAVLLYLMRSK